MSAHVREPRPDREARDQREFDDAVERKGKVVLEWLAGAGILAAVLMSAIALIQSGERHEGTVVGRQAVTQTVSSANVSSAPALKPLSFKIIPSSKPGPDGKKHDAFTQTEFAVHVGQPLKLVIDNTDNRRTASPLRRSA